jgi:hypothetical protein
MKSGITRTDKECAGINIIFQRGAKQPNMVICKMKNQTAAKRRDGSNKTIQGKLFQMLEARVTKWKP